MVALGSGRATLELVSLGTMDGAWRSRAQRARPARALHRTAALHKGELQMKRCNPRIPGVVVVVFALCSIGADSSSSGCKPSGSQSNQSTQSNQNTATKPWCHTDPPIFCAAYCADYDLGAALL